MGEEGGGGLFTTYDSGLLSNYSRARNPLKCYLEEMGIK